MKIRTLWNSVPSVKQACLQQTFETVGCEISGVYLLELGDDLRLSENATTAFLNMV